MRNFSWKYFAMTGDVDAYMLFKEIGDGSPEEDQEPPVEELVLEQEEA